MYFLLSNSDKKQEISTIKPSKNMKIFDISLWGSIIIFRLAAVAYLKNEMELLFHLYSNKTRILLLILFGITTTKIIINFFSSSYYKSLMTEVHFYRISNRIF